MDSKLKHPSHNHPKIGLLSITLTAAHVGLEDRAVGLSRTCGCGELVSRARKAYSRSQKVVHMAVF